MKSYPMPKGPMPRGDEVCPTCRAAPNEPHKPDCPWLLWASKPKASG